MAPTGWTTGAQLTWLKSKLTNYMEMQAQGKLHKFWPSVFEAWFHDFPEHASELSAPERARRRAALTSAQMDALGAAIKKRKDQLQNWFRHQRVKLLRAGPLVRRSEASMANVLFGKKKKERRHQPIELFQMAHKSEIRAALSAAGYDAIRVDNSTFIDEADETQMKLLKSQNSERMRLRAKVVQALYSAAPDSERAMFMDKAGAEQAKGVPEAVGKEERTPEEYQANIDQVCSVMGKVHEAVGTMAGWSGFTVVGGPNPIRRGAVDASTFLRGIYPADVRFSRALTSEAPAEGSGSIIQRQHLTTTAKPKRRSKKKKAAPAPAASAALSLDTAQDDSLEQDGSLDTSSTGLAVLEAAGLSSFSNSPLDNVSLSSPASPHTADDEGDFFGSSVDASLHSGLLYSFGSGSLETPTKRSSYQPSGLFAAFNSPRNSLSSASSQGLSWPSSATPRGRSSWSDFLGTTSTNPPELNYPPPPLSRSFWAGIYLPPRRTWRIHHHHHHAVDRHESLDIRNRVSAHQNDRTDHAHAVDRYRPLDIRDHVSAQQNDRDRCGSGGAIAGESRGTRATTGHCGEGDISCRIEGEHIPAFAGAATAFATPAFGTSADIAPRSLATAAADGEPGAGLRPVKRGGNVGAPAAAPVLGKRASGSVEDGQASLGVGRRVRRKVLDANGEEMQLPVKKTRKEQAEEKAAKAVTATKKKPAAAAAKGKGLRDEGEEIRMRIRASTPLQAHMWLRIELGTPESKINNTSAASTTAPNTTLLIKLDDEQDRGKKKKPRNRTDESGSGPESAPGRRKCL
ncbi:hypothetical protein C8J57DRAFT_1260271 [Mycena rebaudengoi]|nr:hypothetical protein C8J57DRAFT_1260271 [Mycena rebaudengoi]